MKKEKKGTKKDGNKERKKKRREKVRQIKARNRQKRGYKIGLERIRKKMKYRGTLIT